MPFKIRLIPDKWYLIHVGRLHDGTLYWIDPQLVSDGQDTRDFLAAYVFDSDGRLIRHEITDLGLRSDANRLDRHATLSALLKKLGPAKATDIAVYPFSIEAHGETFGLVIRQPDNDGNDEADLVVDALPGFTLMFYPPWQDGLYDT